MESPLTDKSLMARRFARSAATYDGAAIVQRDMAWQLVSLIERVAQTRCFSNVLELGCGTGVLTDLLVQRLTIAHLSLNDIVPDIEQLARRCNNAAPAIRVKVYPGDMESVALPVRQDLVASNAVLQWASDPNTMLEKMVHAAKPGGLLAIATFGPNNLRETRDLAGASLDYLTLPAIQARLSASVDWIECYERIQTVSFESAYAVLQHLKRTGVNGLRQQRWSPRELKEFCMDYESRFRIQDGIPLTYHPIIVVARRRIAGVEEAGGEGR